MSKCTICSVCWHSESFKFFHFIYLSILFAVDFSFLKMYASFIQRYLSIILDHVTPCKLKMQKCFCLISIGKNTSPFGWFSILTVVKISGFQSQLFVILTSGTLSLVIVIPHNYPELFRNVQYLDNSIPDRNFFLSFSYRKWRNWVRGKWNTRSIARI